MIKRDDPIGEIVRIVAALREQPATIASWDAITDLQKKLPPEIAEGSDPIRLDTLTLGAAIEEAEGLGFALSNADFPVSSFSSASPLFLCVEGFLLCRCFG